MSSPRGRRRTGKIYFLIRCVIFFFIQTCPTWFQLSTPQWLFSAFGPDKASQRKARRSRQSRFLRSWTLSCLSTSQVISRRYLLLHNVSLCVDMSSYELLNAAIKRRNVCYCFFVRLCMFQAGSVDVPAGPGSVFLRVQSWMAPLLPLSVGTSPVWACCRPCWVRWRQTWILWVLTLNQHQLRVTNSTEHKASPDSPSLWSPLWDV